MLMENFGPEAQIEILSLSVPVLSTPAACTAISEVSLATLQLGQCSAGADEHSQHDVVASHAPHTLTSSQAATGWLNLGWHGVLIA